MSESVAVKNGAFVLLVDDEPVNIEVMQTYLETADLRSVLAGHTERAREVFSDGALPDCIVLDIMMPRVSGLR